MALEVLIPIVVISVLIISFSTKTENVILDKFKQFLNK